MSAELRARIREWMQDVVFAWRGYWKGKDHRYGHDFAAFVGERLLTDFDLREYEEFALSEESEEL